LENSAGESRSMFQVSSTIRLFLKKCTTFQRFEALRTYGEKSSISQDEQQEKSSHSFSDARACTQRRYSLKKSTDTTFCDIPRPSAATF
jgi:hypothetical protein